MQLRTLRNFLRIPQVLVLSLLLAMMMTFTACDGDEVGAESEHLEEGVGAEEGIEEEGD